MISLQTQKYLPVFVLVSCFLLGINIKAQSNPLKILTINVWSGADYNGIFNVGMYEADDKRETRFQSLLAQLRKENPDVICIQEANKVESYTLRLADSLKYDEIHQVCLAGIKFCSVGLINNLKEGIAIIAKPSLNLQNYDVWKLSGSIGIFGDLLTIHFDESIFCLVAKVKINDKPVFIINTHLSADVPYNKELLKNFEEMFVLKSGEEKKIMLEEWQKKSERRNGEIEELINCLSKLPEDIPIVITGDFNSTVDSPEIVRLQEKGKFISNHLPKSVYSWNPMINKNISYSTQTLDASGQQLDGIDLVSAEYDKVPRLIDHIFFSNHFQQTDIMDYRIVVDSSFNGVYASDHFGIAAEINLSNALDSVEEELEKISLNNEPKIEGLPMLMYDTDIGLGYGAKAFLFNQLNRNESIDLILFNSTKERWYRFVFSLPDFELRQRKVYPLAVDLIFDYDKMIENNFFGIGGESKYEDLEYYTKEPLELALNISRGFSESLIAQIGVKYRTVKNYNFDSEGELKNLHSTINFPRVYYTSLSFSARYDTRNSFINPSDGLVLGAETEFASKQLNSNVTFFRCGGLFQYYSTLWYPKTIFAFRLLTNNITGDELPVQLQLPIGGTWTLRGSPIERFMDKSVILTNAELRFPIYWRFNAVVAIDAGKVFSSAKNFTFQGWEINPAIGLRFNMDTFIVRLDIGLGKETTGFYFNFGHLF